MNIYCCSCEKEVSPRLTNGAEIYPHRKDLTDLPFWKCDSCGNHVGCHHKTRNRTAPLGVIPSPEIREARKKIHSIIDPIWKRGLKKRKDVYSHISKEIGWSYHTAKLKTIEECRHVYAIAMDYRKRFTCL